MSPYNSAANRQILLVEDNPGDADLVQEHLTPTHGLTIVHTTTLAAAVSALQSMQADAVLLDLNLPDGKGVDCVKTLRVRAPELPIVVLTGVNDDIALACIAAGAQDYVRKSDMQPQSLIRAISYSIMRLREASERQRADAIARQHDAIVQASSDAIVSMSLDGRVLSWNRGAELIFGCSAQDAIGQPVFDIIRLDGSGGPQEQQNLFHQISQGGELVQVSNIVCRRLDGRQVALSVVACPLRDTHGDVTAVAAILRDVTESQLRDAQLQAHHAELLERDRQTRALTARLNATREEERTRISREVHDELGQLLTGLKMDLRWMARRLAAAAPPQALSARLVEAEQLLDRIVAAVQRIAVELRPSALDALGLPAAVRDEARRFEARCGIETLVETDDFSSYDRDVATALFRILQELLTNVARHAQATQLRIQLRGGGDDGHLLRVSDNGVGIGAARHGDGRPRSLGLLGMSERAESIGGAFRLEHGPDGGAVTTVTVPHKPKQKEV